MRPFLGIEPCLLDEKGNELDRKNSKGILCLKQPWPGMGRTINGDHKRFLETYFKPFPGYYFTGDGAIMDSDGHIQITGRVDDVMNVSGHRIGTSEVECSLV
jgi:acetyl-CoA synthetase